MARHFLSPLCAARILFGVCVALAALFASPSQAQARQQLLTPPAFAVAMARELQADPSVTSVSIIGVSEIRVKTKDGRSLSFFLTNSYADYRRNPGDLSKLAQKYFGGMLNPPERNAETYRSRIVPVVKDRAWLDEFNRVQRSKGGGAESLGLADDVNEELIVIYAEDLPQTMRYLSVRELPSIGVARDDLRAFAVKNLRALLPKLNLVSGAPVQFLVADGDYDASLLLLDYIWTSGQIKVKGEIVVSIPARDVLMITGSQDKPGLEGLRKMAADFARERPHRLTEKFFVYRDGRFQTFQY